MMLKELSFWTEKLRIGHSLGLETYKEFKRILPQKITKFFFVGMGGSGIAGKIFKTITDQQARTPFFIVDSPMIPAHIDQESVAILCSYSGNTWETITALDELLAKKIPTIILSHGGILKTKAALLSLPFVQLPASLTPRSSLGNTLGFLCGFFDAAGILAGQRITDLFCKSTEHHLALYQHEHHFEPFLYALNDRNYFSVWGVSGSTESVAYRAQTQFNENSKLAVLSAHFPELCHNLLVGYTKNETTPFVLLLALPTLSELLQKALLVTTTVLEERGVTLYKPTFFGDTFEEQLIAVILWADFASCFLAKARGTDAQPVHLIDILKERQKQHNIG